MPKGGWRSEFPLGISDNCSYILVGYGENKEGRIDVLYKTGELMSSFKLDPKVGERILVASSSDGSRFAILWYYGYKNNIDYSKLLLLRPKSHR